MRKLAALFLLALPAVAQTHRFPPIDLFTGDPTGYACNPLSIVQSSTTGQLYTCPNGVYVAGASALSNNQPIQLGNNLGTLGTVLLSTSGNDLQSGDISNKFASLSRFFKGNAFETVTDNGVTFTTPLALAQFAVNGSVNITGAHGNGASIQTYSTNAATGPLCAAADGSATTTGCTNGSTVAITTTGTSGPATLVAGVLNIPQYTATGTGVAYSTPTLNYLPLVSSTSGSGTMVDSTFSDTAGQASVGDAFTVGNSFKVAAQGVASVSQNYPSNSTTLAMSYYNSGVVNDAYTLGTFVNSGTAPTTLATLYGPSTLSAATASTGVGFLLAQNAGLSATNVQNINTPKFKLRGAVYNGSGSSLQDWNIQAFQGTGANPTSTLTLACTGTTGQCSVSVPVITATGGTPGVKFTAAAFATYPACSGNEGLEEAVTDSTTNTWGATVTGGGTNHVKMYCDGTAWTVEAK